MWYRIRYINKRVKVVGLILLLIAMIGGGFAYFSSSGSAAKEPVTRSVKRTHKTVQAKKIKDEKKVLIGKVLSHESARVFPRRSGIVSDILVDIGDKVYKGQPLAYLLPEGVENVSGLEIQLQRNIMQRALDDYKNTEILSQAEIENLEKKLDEEKIALERLKADQYKDGTGEDDTLRLLSTQLQEKIDLQEVRLRDAQNKVDQSRDSLYVAFEHAHQVALQVMGAGGTFTRSGLDTTIYTHQVSDSLAANDSDALNQAVITLNDFRRQLNGFRDKGLSDQAYISLAITADNLLIDLQRVVNSSGTLDPGVLDQLSTAVHTSQTQLFAAKEKFENALENQQLTIVREREGVALLEEQIEKQGTEVQSKIVLKEASIAQFEKEIEFAKARINKNIDSSKNNYLVSNSNYLRTAAEKGHTAIRAPFSGTISRRSINVGELAMSSSSAFDLIEVQTTLSKKAKNEIQFGLPEDLKDVLEVGKSIEFFLPEDELTVYEAEVTRMSPQIDEELHTITVQAKLPEDLRFPHHTSVQVQIITGEKDTYQVDSSIVKRDDEGDYLWVLNGEDVEKLRVEVLEEDGEFAEIAGDLSEETSIVTNYYGPKPKM